MRVNRNKSKNTLIPLCWIFTGIDHRLGTLTFCVHGKMVVSFQAQRRDMDFALSLQLWMNTEMIGFLLSQSYSVADKMVYIIFFGLTQCGFVQGCRVSLHWERGKDSAFWHSIRKWAEWGFHVSSRIRVCLCDRDRGERERKIKWDRVRRRERERQTDKQAREREIGSEMGLFLCKTRGKKNKV